MNNEYLDKKFSELSPWWTKFTIGGKDYGGEHSYENNYRVNQFFEAFPNAKKIIDLGCQEGGLTFQLAKYPNTKVVGIEGRESNIKRAKFAKEVLGIKNVKFFQANLEEVNLISFGRFDAAFCCGILYHMPKPWELIERIKKVTDKIYIWTHYVEENKINLTITTEKGKLYRGIYWKEGDINNPMSGMSPLSFWFSLSSLQSMLEDYGFSNIRLIENNPNEQNGPRVSLAAQK